MGERVLIDIADGVAHVRLNRPEKRNGLDLGLFEALASAGERLTRERAVRAVVLSGEGEAFCAGLDFQDFLGRGEGSRALLQRPEGRPANLAQQVAWVWTEVPVPVIAAIHGVAFGGGLPIALGADLRIAAPDARLSVMEIKWGLVPDMSLTKTLLRLVPLDVAKELTFTGRIVTGEEAQRLGLVTRVSRDPLGDARALAREIADKSPHAIRAGKRLLDSAVDLGVHDAFALETQLQLSLLGSPNQMEAVQANFMKKPPRFADPE